MIKLFKNIILILIFLFLCFNKLFANNVSVNVSIDTNLVKIGERINLNFRVITSKNYNVYFPEIKDSIGKLEILNESQIDTLIKNDTVYLNKNYLITSFEEGTYSIPSFIFSYEKSDEKNLLTTNTEPKFVSFITVEVDTTQSIKDIKAPFEFPITFEELIPYILIFISLLVLVYVIYFFVKKFKNKPKPEVLKYDISIPADIEALEALKHLENEKIWQKGFYKEYYTRLTDILRTYIHRRYFINSFEMTSIEILNELKNKDISQNSLSILDEIFKIADLAKFAKYQPIADDNLKCMKFAYDFIDMTKDISEITNVNKSSTEDNQ